MSVNFVGELVTVTGTAPTITLSGVPIPGAGCRTYAAANAVSPLPTALRCVVFDPIANARVGRNYTYSASAHTLTPGSIIDTTAAGNADIAFAGNPCNVFVMIDASSVVTSDNLAAVLGAYLASLPTTEPGTTGQQWLNGGVFSLS